jgi:cytochrome c oxidase assembly protein subunit 15
MVIIGGITRLTGSGLSITEWKPIMGAIPPMNDEDWQTAFQKYQQIPQFQKLNYDFTIEDFKSIFWWEYIHRLVARFIGIVFIVPFLWFYFKGMLDSKTTRKVLFLFALGILQGLIGWLMVKSGLSERTSVSHIRLAIHLVTAFITFGFTLFFALGILLKEEHPEATNKFNGFIKLLLATVTVQIIYGAFVAGMHAGKIYNTFPLMNGKIIPEGLGFMKPVWLNFFDNQVAVQFIHRILAFLIIVLTFVLLMNKSKFNNFQKRGINFLTAAVSIQFILGVMTLLTQVNIPLALIHQAGAFLLFSVCVYLLFVFRVRQVNLN